jgi:HEPN domain-containing protein
MNRGQDRSISQFEERVSKSLKKPSLKSLKAPEEWIKQSQYDYESAESMFETGRFLYCVFMCHLSLEKALKGFFTRLKNSPPPHSHNLAFLVEQADLLLPDPLSRIVQKLNLVSVPTRYPDDLSRILKEFKKNVVRKILLETREVLNWLDKEF